MTARDQQVGSTRHEVVRAGEADIEVLAQVIAEAFFPLAVCRWLIPDGAARRAAFPAYFRFYLEHAIADGLVETTLGRDAAGLWIPGDGPGEPPEEYAGQLAAITGPHLDRFLAFDQQLDQHHPAGVFHEHLAILAVRPDCQGQGVGTALLASDERTRRLYLAHGYADRGSPIELAGGVRMYPMWRQPRTG